MNSTSKNKSHHILLWGLPGDHPLVAVRDALYSQGYSPVFLDQRYILDTQVELEVDSEIRGTISSKNFHIKLEEIAATYMRPYDLHLLSDFANANTDGQEWQHALGIEDTLTTWANITPTLVVNRPNSMAANNSKPFQAKWIKSLGFEIPDTLITTTPADVLDFWKAYGDVVYKSISGIRSIVSRLSDKHMDRIENIVWCPTQFQQYVRGNDFRVHVVGTDIFSCKIISEADDYRYAGKHGRSVTIEPFDLPEEIANRCKLLASSMKLDVAGIDLRHAPDNNKWYCFEVNPSPGFTYFQDETDQPIDEAIAKLLISAAEDDGSE